jgi:hypothetical protein
MTVTDMVTARQSLAPEVTARIGTLLDTATVEPGVEYLEDGRDMFQSFNRMTFGRTATFCGVNSKTFDQNSVWVKGFPLVVYGGVLCNAVALDQAEQKAETERVFDLGESGAIEVAVMDVLFSPTAAAFPTATDLTPAGGATKPKVGIALLEGWFSANRYVGMPTIHLPTVIASLVMGVDGVAMEENVLRTKLGSKVVNGGGYGVANVSPAGVAAPAGEKWIYATGEVLIRKGDIKPAQVFNQSNNEMVTVAERPYYVAADGPIAAVRVKEDA